MSRYRFVGRGPAVYGGPDRYHWERNIPGDSRVEQVSCPVDWFWRAPEQSPLGRWIRLRGTDAAVAVLERALS